MCKPWVFTKENEILIQKDIGTLKPIAALFTVAKIWKQPKCPSIGEWLKKMWYIYVCVCVCVCVYNGILTIRRKKSYHLQQYG